MQKNKTLGPAKVPLPRPKLTLQEQAMLLQDMLGLPPIGNDDPKTSEFPLKFASTPPPVGVRYKPEHVLPAVQQLQAAGINPLAQAAPVMATPPPAALTMDPATFKVPPGSTAKLPGTLPTSIIPGTVASGSITNAPEATRKAWTPDPALYPYITPPAPSELPQRPARDRRGESIRTGVGALASALGLAISGNGEAIPAAVGSYIQGSGETAEQIAGDREQAYADQVRQVMQRDQYGRQVAQDQNEATQYRMNLDRQAADSLDRQDFRDRQLALQERLAGDKTGTAAVTAQNNFLKTLAPALDRISELDTPEQQAAFLQPYKDLAEKLGLEFPIPIPGEVSVGPDGIERVNPKIDQFAKADYMDALTGRQVAEKNAIPKRLEQAGKKIAIDSLKTQNDIKNDAARLKIMGLDVSLRTRSAEETARHNRAMESLKEIDQAHAERMRISSERLSKMKAEREMQEFELERRGMPKDPGKRIQDLNKEIAAIQVELGRMKPKSEFNSAWGKNIPPSADSIENYRAIRRNLEETVKSYRREQDRLAPAAYLKRDPRNPSQFVPMTGSGKASRMGQMVIRGLDGSQITVPIPPASRNVVPEGGNRYRNRTNGQYTRPPAQNQQSNRPSTPAAKKSGKAPVKTGKPISGMTGWTRDR